MSSVKCVNYFICTRYSAKKLSKPFVERLNSQTWRGCYQHGRKNNVVAYQTRLENANSVSEKHFPVTTLKSCNNSPSHFQL